MSRKMKVAFILLGVILIIAVVVPTVLLLDNSSKTKEEQIYRDLQLSFYSQYKNDDTAEYIGANEVEYIHLVTWRNEMEDPTAEVEEGETAPMIMVEHQTLFINGISLGDIRAYPVK